MSLPLEEALRQCERHAQRMSRAMARIPFPLDGHELAEDTSRTDDHHRLVLKIIHQRSSRPA